MPTQRLSAMPANPVPSGSGASLASRASRRLAALAIFAIIGTVIGALVWSAAPAGAQVVTRLFVTATATPGVVQVRQAVTVGYAVVDPNPGQQIKGGIFIDFGDGSSQQAPPVPTLGSVLHTYSSPGTYVITVSAANIGLISGEGTTSVVVTSTPTLQPAFPVLPAITGCPWTGLWDTGIYGQLSLVQNGAQVTGSYSLYPSAGAAVIQGQVTATVQGNNLSGSWSQAPTYVGQDAGTFTFTIAANCNQFTGQWRMSTTPLGFWDGSWNGSRLQ